MGQILKIWTQCGENLLIVSIYTCFQFAIHFSKNTLLFLETIMLLVFRFLVFDFFDALRVAIIVWLGLLGRRGLRLIRAGTLRSLEMIDCQNFESLPNCFCLPFLRFPRHRRSPLLQGRDLWLLELWSLEVSEKQRFSNKYWPMDH